MPKLRFGGPNLNEKQQTWYDRIDDDKHAVNGGLRTVAKFGDVVDVRKVGNWSKYQGEPTSDSQHYVDSGMATLIEDEETVEDRGHTAR